MARKKDESGAGAAARLNPVDVQQIQFRRALRGYDEQEVDDFLDRVTEELTLLMEERRSATERAGSLPTVRVASAGDAAAAQRQAEDIVRQARERADQIVREATQRAAAIVREAEVRAAAGGVVAAGAGGNAAIASFVAREREFLQQLASLVQGHAEGVKGMVASAREASTAPASGAGDGGSGPAAAAGAAAAIGTSAGSGGASAPGGPDRPGPGSPGGPSGSPPQASAAGSGAGAAAVAPERPAPDPSPGRASVATEPRPEERPRPAAGDVTVIPSAEPTRPPGDTAAGRTVPPAGAAHAVDSQDESLRGLFWGED